MVNVHQGSLLGWFDIQRPIVGSDVEPAASRDARPSATATGAMPTSYPYLSSSGDDECFDVETHLVSTSRC